MLHFPGLAVNSSARVWSPYKDLQVVVEAAISRKQPEAIHDLEVMLRKHKPDFLSLLKTPPKNAAHRENVKKSNTVGLPIVGEERTQTFPENMIEEALILSDLFNLNEFAALELLMAGEENKPDFPGLTRGLVAVLLFYDGRRSLVVALRHLLLSLKGHTWTLDLTRDLIHLTNPYIQQLIDDNLTDKILTIIKDMDVIKEFDKLQNNRALGPARQRHQIKEIYEEIRLTCAECLFCVACQKSLNKTDTLRLLAHLKGVNSVEADGSLHPVTQCLLMTFLYCLDVSLLEREDADEITRTMPVFSDDSYIVSIHREMKEGNWALPGLKAVAQFAWGIMLRQLSQYPAAGVAGDCYEEDEHLVDMAIEGQVFRFLLDSVVCVEKFHKEEFHLRRIHSLMTDFIYHLPLKVKEVRNRGDETARIIMNHLQEGQEPPTSLRRDFEQLLNLIGAIYSKDPLGLSLSLDFWCPPEPISHQDTFHHKPPQRQVGLYKFVRMAGDLLPPSLYVPYVSMLTGLASDKRSSQHCYNLLKMNGGSTSPVSWDHIFSSLQQYYSNLRRETLSSSDMSQYRVAHSRVISAQELEGLLAVIKLTRTVTEESEVCRVAMGENQHWSVMISLFGLVTCSVPPQMKAELLRTLAGFARTPEIASSLWQSLEASQLLVTVPATSSKQTGGLQVELDEIEARNEEYPMSRAFLEFLSVLTECPIPAGLGAGLRAPGFSPYLDFIRSSIFLKFNIRAYKQQSEKWEIAGAALEILKKLLYNHEVTAEDFVTQRLETQGGVTVEANKPPGHVLLQHMLQDSLLLKMILRILDDAMMQFQLYTSTQGQEELEQLALLCLQMVEITLEKEDTFVDMVRETGSPLLVTSMAKLLLGINPRTGKADHLVTIAKYLMYNGTLPHHAQSAMKILYLVCKSAPIQGDLVTLFTENQEISVELLHGFVECLDVDDPEVEGQDSGDDVEEVTDGQVRNTTRQHLLKLLIHSQEQTAPNLTHFLLGFEIRKPVIKTNLQDPGVLNSPKTCLHSILTILSRGMGSNSCPNCLRDTPRLAELCYRLIYMLCTNTDTSASTLRYLRTSHDFLYQQLQHIPYNKADFKESVANHQSWLLKTVAVELRITSLNRQRSHTQRLMKLLLDDFEEDQTSVMQLMGVGDESELTSTTRYGDVSMSRRQLRGKQNRRRLLRLLDAVDFCQPYPAQLQLEFFEPGMIQGVIACTERRDEDGVPFYDVKMLHRILMNELNNLQGITMAGQRQMVQDEINGILAKMIERNRVSQSMHTKRQAFDAWRQVTEIIFSACPEDLLSGEIRQTLLFELLQDLLMKVADDDALSDLTAPVSGVFLTLMANLHLCFMTEDQEWREEDKHRAKPQSTNQTVSWGQGSGSRTLFATSLQMTLKGLIEHIMRSSGGQQRVRVNLYGALLHCLQIAQKPRVSVAHIEDETSRRVEQRLQAVTETEYDQLRKENIASIVSYGDAFIDLVCRDACDGLDIGKMTAFSVLDILLTMDQFNQTMMFLSSKGYLQHLVDSLTADDENLLSALTDPHVNPKAVCLFESKVSLLTRVAKTAEGALTLLRCGVMQRLASCSFLDVRPDTSGDQTLTGIDDDLLPNPKSRYRDLLFASLRLCLALLTSLGLENTDAKLQVMQFVFAHVEVFQMILRDKQSSLNLSALQELALTTAVMARANHHDEDSSDYEEGDSSMMEFSGHRVRIQRQMIALLPKYCLSEKLNKHLKDLESQAALENRDVRSEIMEAYLEIATNVMSYCRTLITTGLNARFSHVIFGPGLEEAMARDLPSEDDLTLSTLSPSQAPNLGVVVYQLKHCANYFMTVFESRKQHMRKLEGLSDLSSEDLKQFSGVAGADRMSSQQRQTAARKTLTQIVANSYRELQSYSYIIENSLYLLWRHLEYYLKNCVPVDQQPAIYQTQAKRQQQIRRLQDMMGVAATGVGNYSQSSEESTQSLTSRIPESRRGVSKQEIEFLKQVAPSALPDSLFKKILEIDQIFCKGRSHYGFVEAIIRRIKRLLRLHTGS